MEREREEIKPMSNLEAAKFIGYVAIKAPSLVIEAGRDYIIKRFKHETDKPRQDLQ